MYSCEYCDSKSFDNRYSLGGHYRHCVQRKEKILANAYAVDIANLEANNYEEDNFDHPHFNNDNALDLNGDEFVRAYENATNAYIISQMDYLDHEELSLIASGFTEMINNVRSSADIRVYLEICEFVSNCHGLSLRECDELLHVIRRVSVINGSEIPLPQKYSTIHDKILKAVKNKTYRIVKTHYEYSEELFGVNNNLGKIPAVVADILDIVSKMLVDNDIYPTLHLNYSEKVLVNEEVVGGKRVLTEDIVYGEFRQSQFFKEAEINVQHQWGKNVKILPVFIGIDATTSGNLTATPMYLSLGNMDIDTLRSHAGCELCGYMPMSLISKATMYDALHKNHIRGQTAKEECIALHSRWLEQECLNDLFEPIRWYDHYFLMFFTI